MKKMNPAKKIAFDLPLINSLNHGPMRLRQHAVAVELELTKGENLFTSVPMEVGTFYNFKVFAHISIPYSYDPKMKYVTIGGPEETSDKQLAIHTSLDQHPKFTSSRRLNITGAPKAAPNMLTDFINNNPVVEQVNQTAIRHAIDSLVIQLLDAGVQGVIQTGLPPFVTPGNYQEYKAIFAPKKAAVEHVTLDDLHEVQKVVESTYYGTITWVQNYSFANIIGSTHDPKPIGYSTWIGLWEAKCNNGYKTDKCSSFNYSDGSTPFNCNTSDFVGGHVIPGKTAKSVATGGVAYIFPICKRHNGNDNIYMSSRYNPKGVVLHNYNQ